MIKELKDFINTKARKYTFKLTKLFSFYLIIFKVSEAYIKKIIIKIKREIFIVKHLL